MIVLWKMETTANKDKEKGTMKKIPNKANRPKWMKPLNRDEVKHIYESTERGRLYEVIDNIWAQEAARERNPSTAIPCFTCNSIGRKLGLIITNKGE